METITTEQLWNRRVMDTLWKHNKKEFGSVPLDKLYQHRAKTSRQGLTIVEYGPSLDKTSKRQGKLGYGRLYSKGCFGLEAIQNELRGSLAQEYYYDVDIKNAQPVLLLQFAKREFNVALPQLATFCDNRDEYYAKISDNRETAKNSLFRVLYGGRCEFPFLLPLKEELDQFATKLLKLPQYLELYKACQESKPPNPRGSFLSFLAQTEERKAMLAMREFFMEKGWSVDVLCYDGIMVRKKEKQELTPSLLTEAEAWVLHKTNYSIQLANKPFSAMDMSQFDTKDEKILSFDILVNDAYAAQELVKIAGSDLLSADGELFSKVDGVWLPGEDGLRRLISVHKDDLVFKQEAKSGIKIHDYGGSEKHITPLLKQIRLYVKPGSLPIQFAYTFVEGPTDQTHLETFLSLVRLWSRGNETFQEYILSYFALMIQKPTVNPGVMIIVTGKKGCGKDTLLNFLSKYVVGNTLSKTYNSTEQFFDHYDVKQNKILLKLEEATRYACLKNQDVLKSFVTSEQITVNEKHKASFSSPNYCHIFFTTNKENPVAFTEQERRFLLLACSDEKVGDLDYWTFVYDTLKEKAGKAVGEFLMARPLEGFNPRVYPVSNYQEAVIEAERSVEERFVEQWDGRKVNSSVFFQQYRDWCAEQCCQSITSSIVFGKAMGKPHRDGLLERTKTGGLTYYWKP